MQQIKGERERERESRIEAFLIMENDNGSCDVKNPP